jgi:hypothetical protein
MRNASRPSLCWLAVGTTISLLAAAHSDRADAAATLRDGLKPLAQAIFDVVVKDQHQSAIAVAAFEPSQPRFDTNAGTEIEEDLKSLLGELKPGIVQRDATLAVSGQYEFVPSKTNAELKVIKVIYLIKDQMSGGEIDKKDIEVDSTKAIAQAMGFTGALSKDASKVDRNKELQRGILKPQCFLDGTKIRARSGSPYAVEILVKPLDNQDRLTPLPRAPSDVNGEAFVDIKQNELYEVRVSNESGRDVAVAISVDGLDVFHFSNDRRPDGQPLYSHFIVHPQGYRDPAAADSPPHDGTLTVVGWHKSVAGTENYLSFLVTEHGKGAVSQPGIKARGKVGVIEVQFSECQPLAKGAKAAGGNETGFGPPREVHQTPVKYEIENPHEFVSVRYTRSQP